MTRRCFAFALAAAVALVARPAATQDEDVKARLGRYHVEERGRFTRLVYDDDAMVDAQFHTRYLDRADVLNVFGHGTAWEGLALVGAHARWDTTLEPLTYYHRTGPLGAVFHHLRTRNGGADAAAPVGVGGLLAGAAAAYARPGQEFTFYSAHNELAKLIAGTGRHFTHVPEARKRGAKLAFRYGPLREQLEGDADKRFALLIVEPTEVDPDPGDRLTVEAVKLYVDRTRRDGVVALHTTSRRHNLEAVVEKIADELKLSARVRDDDAGSTPGKSSSSWVVLARTDADLGILARPTTEQIVAFGTKNEPVRALLRKNGPEKLAREAVREAWGLPAVGPGSIPTAEVSRRFGPEVALLYRYLDVLGKRDEHPTLGQLAERLHGLMFRPLEADLTAGLQTDANRLPLPPARR